MQSQISIFFVPYPVAEFFPNNLIKNNKIVLNTIKAMFIAA